MRYHTGELELNGLLDNRWPGDAATIPWDFAAVGNGAHADPWWQSFATALERHTTARVISIEHEDRLISPEAGVVASAAALNAGARSIEQ